LEADLDEVAAIFFGEEKRFPVDRTDLKIVARWRYDWYANERENVQNLRKWAQSLCEPCTSTI